MKQQSDFQSAAEGTQNSLLAKNVSRFLTTWIHQPSFPLVRVDYDGSSKVYSVSQAPFQSEGKRQANYRYKWELPLGALKVDKDQPWLAQGKSQSIYKLARRLHNDIDKR